MNINNVNNLTSTPGVGAPGTTQPSQKPGGASFSDMLKDSIAEVSKLQRDASQAVEALATGKTEDITGVMTAMEKSEIAFKTLLAIRAKLMDAYEEIKQIQV